jgi:hypothetical protein
VCAFLSISVVILSTVTFVLSTMPELAGMETNCQCVPEK